MTLLVAVDRLSTQAEHGLILGFSHLGDGSARGVSLSDEYARELPEIFLALWQLVTVVETAVAQLAVIDIRFLVPFPCLLLDSGDLLALGLRLLDLVLDDRDDVLVDAKIVVQVSGDEVVDERPDRRSAVDLDRAVRVQDLLAVFVRLLLFPHIGGTEFRLGLTFEVRLLDLDAYRSDYSLTAVLRSVVFLVELLEGLGYGLPESGQMRSSVTGVLSVDERSDVLAVGVAVRQHDLYILSDKMDRLVKRSLADGVLDEIKQTVFGFVCRPVQHKSQSFLKVGVVLDHRLDIVHVELEVPEHRAVRSEGHKSSVLLSGFLLSAAVHEFSAHVTCPRALTVSEGLHIEPLGQGVHRLGTHTVQPHGLLEGLVIELSSGVQLAGRLDD